MSLNIVLVLTVVNLVASGVLCNGSGNNGGKAIVDNSVITKIMDKIDMLEQEVARLKQNSEDSSRGKRTVYS